MTSDPGGQDLDGLARRQGRESGLPVAVVDPPAPGAVGDGAVPGGPAGEPTPEQAKAQAASAKAKSQRRNIVEWLVVIGGAVLIAVVVRTFVFQTFWIPSESMSSTLVTNDRVIVNKLSYKFHDINRGDVVVFERPPTEPANGTKDLIKRVIGLPGERVSVTDGEVKVNGRTLKEPYTHGLPSVYQPGCGSGKVTGIDTVQGLRIPKGHIFVMGDNRINSTDGRCFGPIDEDLVVGRAFVIMWPPSKAGGL